MSKYVQDRVPGLRRTEWLLVGVCCLLLVAVLGLPQRVGAEEALPAARRSAELEELVGRTRRSQALEGEPRAAPAVHRTLAALRARVVLAGRR